MKLIEPTLDTYGREMITLGATELANLRRFVNDVLHTIELDDSGVTYDLEEGALVASEILGMIKLPEYENDPEDV